MEIDVQGILLERLCDAVAELAAHMRQMPAPQVTMEPVDLGEIVTAVNGLRPSATAEEIAAAIGKVIAPPQNDSEAIGVVLRELMAKLEQLDFRMKGSQPAFGASGPSNISDNAGRLLGIVTSITNPVQVDGVIVTATPEKEVLFDYDVRTDGNPIYIGSADPGTAQGDPYWTVYKFTYDSSARATRKQVQEPITWTGRASGW